MRKQPIHKHRRGPSPLASGSVTGNARRQSEPYVRGKSGLSRPGPKDEYTVDGVTHTFDGKCHDDCENVR